MLILRVLVCALLLSIPQALVAQAPLPVDPAAVAAKIDAYMQAQAAHNGFSGTVLVAREGKPVIVKGYGFANAEWQIPNTADTKFRVGSITKQFTSMVIMKLREQGKVKLEDSVCVFVAPCPETWKPVTIHHLLTHTSGIPSYTGLAEWRKVNMQPKTVDEMIGFFRDLPLQWTPGEKYAYNNSGYFLLGAVIEKITGKKYEDALREMVLAPLGLKNTGYDWPATIIPKRASGYAGLGAAMVNAPALDMQQPYAAGSLYSTVEDLLAWDQALYTETLLPAAAKEKMWTPVLQNYAYGWNIREASPQTFGYKRILHGGGINGFSAMLIRVPDVRVTAIVLSNNSTNSSSTVANDLLAIYFGQPYSQPKPPITLSVAILDRYVGQYEMGPGETLTISRDGARLFAQPTTGNKVELFAESETKFFAKGAPIGMTFVVPATGNVVEAVLHLNGDRTLKKVR
jgi:CubicO group peptidase (beta-lactamase class C family)